MVLERTFEPKEGADIVNEKEKEKTMENSLDSQRNLTAEDMQTCDAFYPALMAGTMVSLCIGVFSVCTVGFWVGWKIAQDLGEKVSIQHDCKTGDVSDNKIEKRAGHISQTEKTDSYETLKDSSPGTGDSWSRMKTSEITVHKCFHLTCKNKPWSTMADGQNDHVVSSARNLEYSDCDFSNTVCQNKMENEMFANHDVAEEKTDAVGTNNLFEQLPSSKRQTIAGRTVSVQLGPVFTQCMNINPEMANTSDRKVADKIHYQEELDLCDKEDYLGGPSQNKTTQEACVPEYKSSIGGKCVDASSNHSEVPANTTGPDPLLSSSIKNLSVCSEARTELDRLWLSRSNNIDVKTGSQHKTCCKLQSETIVKQKPQVIAKAKVSVSKSLDSQKTSLQKGCRLLETKPVKSSLKKSGSDGCLKKYVHFPEDIRNIRVVHKYDSFDDGILLNINEDKNEEGSKDNV